jgi:predicted acylesterase/phospholipase RssA
VKLGTSLVDFERLAQAPIKLFITATNVRTGRGKVFWYNAITPEVLLASACLPTMFQAIEIDGEPYWDGGYSGSLQIDYQPRRAHRPIPSQLTFAHSP